MPQKFHWKKKRQSESLRAKSQQRRRLKKGLFKKAAEYSLECESDVFIMIRTRKNGQRFTFNSSASERWLPSMPELGEYFPPPINETLEDIISGFNDRMPLDRQEEDSAYGSPAEKDAA